MLVLLIFSSCGRTTEEGNSYLKDINDEISKLHESIQYVDVIYRRESNKYKQSNDDLYLIGSKYIQFFNNYHNHKAEKLKQIPLAYELLKLNNGRYEYISIICNFHLALLVEYTSPQQSMQFINEAIKIDEEEGRNFFLPHTYHMKGRLLYDKQDYHGAISYFQKALENLDKSDILYRASMHNNFGMCYDKINKTEIAIVEARKAVKLLEKKSKLNSQERYYTFRFKGQLGYYLYKVKNYNAAEKLLIEELEFHTQHPEYVRDVIPPAKRLIDLYSITRQHDKIKNIITVLINIEADLADTSQKIQANEIIKNYYAYNNNLEKLKLVSQKLDLLHRKLEKERFNNFNKVSSTLNSYMIQSIDKKYSEQIGTYQRKIKQLISGLIISAVVILIIIKSVKSKNKRESIIVENERKIFQQNQKIYEQDLLFHKQKIENLVLNLNLKMEMEKFFLDNLKELKNLRMGNRDSEKVIKELYQKLNNLMQINKKNYPIIDDSSEEHKEFMKNLSQKFPQLTQQELKFCAYIKLNLSAKEISLLENITEGSVRVYKTRIKVKLGLQKAENLNNYMTEMSWSIIHENR